mmetsp:Transcript_9931/g.60645  ORF Transcript_9931/g.60645 Transcript_9931/m.60645 type:complete len:209 (-) Transcript_9931:506-1132(-)
MMATDASRKRWYSLSVKVCAGATVMESPVCTPMGSKFSMLQTITTLSARSLITSSSYSFQPSRDISINTWFVTDASIPRLTISSNSSWLYATPPPVPPRVNAGRMIMGKLPIFSATLCASSIVVAVPEDGVLSPMRAIASLKRSLSSALLMASSLAPMSSTPYFSSTPLSARDLARLSPVCPPMVGRTASGLSLAMISSTDCGVMGPT